MSLLGFGRIYLAYNTGSYTVICPIHLFSEISLRLPWFRVCGSCMSAVISQPPKGTMVHKGPVIRYDAGGVENIVMPSQSHGCVLLLLVLFSTVLFLVVKLQRNVLSDDGLPFSAQYSQSGKIPATIANTTLGVRPLFNHSVPPTQDLPPIFQYSLKRFS